MVLEGYPTVSTTLQPRLCAVLLWLRGRGPLRARCTAGAFVFLPPLSKRKVATPPGAEGRQALKEGVRPFCARE